LLAAALEMGALMGDAGEKESHCLYEFGRNIGIAFQLQDDLLDVFADPSVFGKVTGNDIASNKKTILLIEALNLAKGKTREKLMKWITGKDHDRDEKIRAVTSIYAELQIAESVTDKIRHYHEQAVGQLNKLRVAPERKSELLAFSQYLMNRTK
jgi:geranylgeranyl diphosphate synthase type II